jgi:hypothetical protein
MWAKITKFFKYMIWLIIIPIGLFALYTWATLNWVYSSGERAGFVQKISQKGFVCKTYEGELILVTVPGTQAEKFFFTVKDPAIFRQINETIGKRVRLVYEQHKWIPSSCFGDTEYFVTQVHEIDQKVDNGLN